MPCAGSTPNFSVEDGLPFLFDIVASADRRFLWSRGDISSFTGDPLNLYAIEISDPSGVLRSTVMLRLLRFTPRKYVLQSSTNGAHWAASVGRILTGPAMDTHNAFDRPDTIDPVPFAGRSDHGKLVFDLATKSVAVVRID